VRLINAASPEVLALSRNTKGLFTVTVKDFTIYFSKSLCVTFGFSQGDRVNFINDEKDWRFFVNRDPDGFMLFDAARESGALQIQNAGLTHLIRQTTGDAEQTIYAVTPTKLEYQGVKIFMIRTDKAFIKSKS